MSLFPNLKISVITATLNSVKTVGRLIDSLRRQTDSDFEWVVVDGGSTDGTLEVLRDCSDFQLVLSSQKDFGIYDALNRGIKTIKGDYYIVIGADDLFYPKAIEFFKEAIRESKADIIAANVAQDGKICKIRKNLPSWYGVFAGFVVSHSVATAIKTDLHNKIGLYSNKFPIAADALFLKKARHSGASCYIANFVAGEFSSDGLSSNDIPGILTEFFRIQLITEKNKFLQVLLLIVRLFWNYRRL